MTLPLDWTPMKLSARAMEVFSHVRVVDTSARYGGEEFAVILVETDLPAAAEVAECLRARVEREAARAVQDAQPDISLSASVTISVGVGLAPEHDTTPTALIHAADTALYRAKRAGKNRVRVYPLGDE